VHSDARLILLSRIDGDAPRAQIYQRWRFWMVREQADFNFRSRSIEHSKTGPSLLPFDRSKSDSELLFIPPEGKGTST